MMYAYGRCTNCIGIGALWRHWYLEKRFVLFGKLVRRMRYICDECDCLPRFREQAKKTDQT
jgi:hypothetical protein